MCPRTGGKSKRTKLPTSFILQVASLGPWPSRSPHSFVRSCSSWVVSFDSRVNVRFFQTCISTHLAVAALTLAARVCAAEPAPDDSRVEEARLHFNAGVAYLQDPEGERYEEAYAEFKKSYELSKSPKVL